jgi:hypothetical protein
MINNSTEFWIILAKDWPPVILAKNADRHELPGFPYTKGYFRNLITGKEKDNTLPSFKIGKLLAVTKDDLIDWLARRTV